MSANTRRRFAVGLPIIMTIALWLLLTVLAGCSATDAVRGLFVSGVSLDVVGTQFVAVTEQVTAGCDSKIIPATTCQKYREFGVRFKKTYPLAVGLWTAARDANDVAARERAEAVVVSLARDLSALAVEALGALEPETGQ